MIHPEHKAFARAVVALARQHGMDGISMQFRFDFNHPRNGTGRNDPVKMNWTSGRHGDENRIHLETASSEGIPERDDDQPAPAGKEAP